MFCNRRLFCGFIFYVSAAIMATVPFSPPGPRISRSIDAKVKKGRLQKRRQFAKINHYIHSVNPKKSVSERRHLANMLIVESERLKFPAKFKIDRQAIDKVAFLAALIQVESTFTRTAISTSNAQGYMQLKQTTVAWMDKKMGYKPGQHMLFHTRTNLQKGIHYLNHLSGFMKSVRFICLAYNAGPGSVQRGHWHEKYWRDILRNYRRIVAMKLPQQSITKSRELAIN